MIEPPKPVIVWKVRVGSTTIAGYAAGLLRRGGRERDVAHVVEQVGAVGRGQPDVHRGVGAAGFAWAGAGRRDGQGGAGLQGRGRQNGPGVGLRQCPERNAAVTGMDHGAASVRVRSGRRHSFCRPRARGRIEGMTNPRAGQPAAPSDLVDVAKLERRVLRPSIRTRPTRAAGQLRHVGHRGSSLSTSFNEDHILATSQAICEYRAGRASTGRCSSAGHPRAERAGHRVGAGGLRRQRGHVLVDSRGGYTPTPALSRAILAHNAGARPRSPTASS